MKVKITVELKLDNPNTPTAEEIKEDLLRSENQIGWNYDYKIIAVEVTNRRN